MTLKEQLLRDAKECTAREGISMSRLATKVMNDGKFFNRIAGGGEFTTTTYEKFQAYFAASAERYKAA